MLVICCLCLVFIACLCCGGTIVGGLFAWAWYCGVLVLLGRYLPCGLRFLLCSIVSAYNLVVCDVVFGFWFADGFARCGGSGFTLLVCDFIV